MTYAIQEQEEQVQLTNIIDIYDIFTSKADESLSHHPFKKIKSQESIINLFPHFLALSIAFPYIQAGSQLPLIQNLIDSNEDVSAAHEILSVVGHFLCWDETGGANVLEFFGKPGLAKILETKKWFHANMLREDIFQITGEQIKPNFAEPTKSYLNKLIKGFSNLNPVIRCAHMVAFEYHAHVIIDSLWHSIGKQFTVNPNQLKYFRIHVGGDDCAEAYHVTMTKEMINYIVKPADKQLFITTALDAIDTHLNWSLKIATC
ncbi:Uncharacterised protein [Legionella beliardensis]|uniref:Pyrroloquinoline quinone (Coenzyme PQQ) biosynthesis protein C n=1 Tax=Legionella beliardensis TaxID=91822 RepID=A0A378I416_9GAMM|nr:hypothetical protein [Legionella beliardensis]STX29733.1 Uncharacterised protein [Legionella beliardensis]